MALDDDILFAALDEESKPLREASNELAQLLSQADNSSNQILFVTQALKAISTTDIKHMNTAVIKFKKAFSTLSFRSTDDNIFGPDIPDVLYPQLVEKYSVVIREVAALAVKARKMTK